MRRILLAAILLSQPATAEPLALVSWNVESGGANPATIAKQLAELGRYDAYCLQEVSPKDAGRYAAAIREARGKTYKHVLSSTGGGDRLLIVFDEERLELLEASELFRQGKYRLNDWRHRSPLMLRVRDKTNGVELFLMTVHLARGNDKLRTEQANGLVAWAKEQDIPALAIGDFNFDYHFNTGRGQQVEMPDGRIIHIPAFDANESFQAFMLREDGPWEMAALRENIDTNWADRDGDGKDDYPDSILDFGFIYTPGPYDETELRRESANWRFKAFSKVIVRDGDFPDDETTSDHRPVTMRIDWVRTPGTANRP